MVRTVDRIAIAALLVPAGATVAAPAVAADTFDQGVRLHASGPLPAAKAAPAAGLTPPGTPVATEVTETSALLTWRPSTGGTAGVQYEIWYVRNGASGFYSNTPTASYRLRWLTPGTGYTWMVRATDGQNQSAFSAPVVFRTDPAPLDSEPPSTPGAPVISAVTATTATLSWAASTDNASAPNYLVYAAAESVGTPTVVGGGTEPWTQVNLLIPDLRYDFSVVARDVSGNRSASSTVTKGRTAADPEASCRGSYTAGTADNSAIVRITNTGPVALSGWSVRFTLPENQRVVSASHSWAQDGRDVVLWWSGWSDALNVYETLELVLALSPGQSPPGQPTAGGPATDRSPQGWPATDRSAQGGPATDRSAQGRHAPGQSAQDGPAPGRPAPGRSEPDRPVPDMMAAPTGFTLNGGHCTS